MGVQAFVTERAIERFNEGIVGRLAGPREVQRDAIFIGPAIPRLRDELGTVAHWEAPFREPLWP